MAITELEARTRILDELGAAIEALELGLASLGDAFELLAVGAADRLEAELFRPMQKALGRGKRTHAGFTARMGLTGRGLEPAATGASPRGAKALIEHAVAAAVSADVRIAELQDSLLPVESGDAELRAGLSQIRELLAGVPVAARGFVRTLGR